ncbi:hypothetical signaling protein [Desulfocucumis palustris]|uniref:Hypothetical signaling protein n=1 Tax=Desulfocucumis palustris TaxID=1898651 RepID=A0A2L2XBA0_9FIRM|nr:S-layer homology domain-containing protein [Desulfocucumis palustris]GBF33485.1 hypothetical signaling protein [Desulfocucumis palustris]
MSIRIKMASFCGVAVLSLAFAGHCLAAPTPFTDLQDIKEKEKICALQQKGYVKGVADGIYAPNNAIITAESIQLIVNALELNLDAVRFFKEPKATDCCQKADNNAWYADALITAAVNGIEFSSNIDPDQQCTREEFTYYLIKAMEKQNNLPMINIVPVDIADQEQMSAVYSGAVQRALAYGVTQLDESNKFNPKADISRAEAAEQIYNALEYIKAVPAQL